MSFSVVGYSNSYSTGVWYTATFDNEPSGTQINEDWLTSTETTQYFRILSDDFKIRMNTANPEGKWTFDYPLSMAIGDIHMHKNANDADTGILYWNFTDADDDHMFRWSSAETAQLGAEIRWVWSIWSYDSNSFVQVTNEYVTDGNEAGGTYSLVNFTLVYTNHSLKFEIYDIKAKELQTYWITDPQYFTDDFYTDDSSIRHIEFYMDDADADDYDVIDDFAVRFIDNAGDEFTDVADYVAVYGDWFVEFGGFGEDCYYHVGESPTIYYNLTDEYFYEKNCYMCVIYNSREQNQTTGYIYNNTQLSGFSGYQELTWYVFPNEGRYIIRVYNVTSSGLASDLLYESDYIDVCPEEDDDDDDDATITDYSMVITFAVCLLLAVTAFFVTYSGLAFGITFLSSVVFFSIPGHPFALFPISMLAIFSFMLIIVFLIVFFRR